MRRLRTAGTLVAGLLVVTGCAGTADRAPDDAASSARQGSLLDRVAPGGEGLLGRDGRLAGRSGEDGVGAAATSGRGLAPRDQASRDEVRALPPVVRDAMERSPRPPRSPAEAASAVAAAERVVADDDVADDVLAAAAHVQQLAYREWAKRRGWDARAYAALPRDLRRPARLNVESRREFLSMQAGYRPNRNLPAWRVVAPAPAAELLRHYRAAERRFGVGWEHLAAINLVETAMGRIRGTSVAGARGPMQFIPETWARYGRGDIDDPRDAIFSAARYLEARGFTRRGGVPGALFAYNNDVRYVRAVDRLATVMQERPRAYAGYYHWQVYYTTVRGDVRLPVGYERTSPVPVDRYLRTNPLR